MPANRMNTGGEKKDTCDYMIMLHKTLTLVLLEYVSLVGLKKQTVMLEAASVRRTHGSELSAISRR